jgi:hypothetical protein
MRTDWKIITARLFSWLRTGQLVNCSAYESACLDRLGGLNLNIGVNQINVMSLPG